MDVGETVKIRVIDEEFVESEPVGPPDNSGSGEAAAATALDNLKPPYRIIGAINESGLGIDSWWTQAHNDGGEDEEEEEET